MTDFDATLLRSAEPFALGASRYWDTHPELTESQPRIFVRFRPQGAGRLRSFLALFDTGAHFCLLHRDVVDLIRDQLPEPIGPMKLQTARGPIQGELYRHPIELIADTGRDLHVESTLFVTEDWRGPNFFGYVGMFDRLRFAVNPLSNRFYFGPLD